VVSLNSFDCYAIEWLLETLANQSDSPKLLIEMEHTSTSTDAEIVKNQNKKEKTK